MENRPNDQVNSDPSSSGKAPKQLGCFVPAFNQKQPGSDRLMMKRVLIEFVVDVPNDGVAKDVQTRLVREHHTRLCQVLTSVMGYEPLQAPGKPGVFVAHENVTWDAASQYWVGESDDGEDDDDA